MKVAWLLLIWTWGSAWGGSVELVDIDKKKVEIRLAAVLVIDEAERAKADPLVRLSICPNPLVEFSAICVNPALTTQLPLSHFLSGVQVLLSPTAPNGEENLRRQATVLFSRDQFRKKIHRGDLDPETKIKGEVLLDDLVAAIDPESLVKKRTEIEDWVEQIKTALLANVDKPAGHLYLRQVESDRFEGLLAPFVTWLDRSVCRCEIETLDGLSQSPTCVLRRGRQTLAVSEALLGECETQQSCQTRRWHSPSDAQGEFNFEKSVGEQCGGYYSLGPVIQRTFKTIPDRDRGRGP